MNLATQRLLALLVVLAIPLGSAGLVYAGGFGPAQGVPSGTTDGTTPVAGPASSTQHAVAAYADGTGKVLKNTSVLVGASTPGQVSWPTGLGGITHIQGPTDQHLFVVAPSGRSVILGGGGGGRWSFGAADFRPVADNTYDIGTSSARVRYVYAAGGIVPSVLHKNVTPASTTAVTTEETLWSYSLPAGTLASDGQAVRITVFGTTAANGNTKTMRVKFGGTTLGTVTTAASAAAWSFAAIVARTGATAQVSITDGTIGNLTRASLAGPAETLSGAVTISCTGQNGTANAGDITFRGAIVEFLP